MNVSNLKGRRVDGYVQNGLFGDHGVVLVTPRDIPVQILAWGIKKGINQGLVDGQGLSIHEMNPHEERSTISFTWIRIGGFDGDK